VVCERKRLPIQSSTDIQSAMTAEIAAQHAAGAVTSVMKDGKVIRHAAVGYSDQEKQISMSTDGSILSKT